MNRGSRCGSVSVEAALALGLILIPLVLGVVDLGLGIIVHMRLDRAAQAALFYAWGTPGPSTSAVQSAAQSGYGATSPTLTATASIACYCITPTATRQSGTAASCTATCTSGQVLADWVTINVRASFGLPFPLPSLGSTFALSSTATARIQ
jgi:Flp pilus assembly protein TadG